MSVDEPLAVLISGGLDSAILLGESLATAARVHPLYVRTGAHWEDVELSHLRRYLDALAGPRLAPLQLLDQPVADLYGRHWSMTGDDVPDANTPDEAVYLPGRNVLLLSKPLLWCHLNQVKALALGILGSNPFPDATPTFFDGFAQLVSAAVADSILVLRPYADLHKVDVMRRGRDLPLRWSFSCIRPVTGRHCGRCNKCAERRQAFRAAELADPTDYAEE